MVYVPGVGEVNDPYFSGAPNPSLINDPTLDGYINDIYAFFANTWGHTEGQNPSLFNNAFGLPSGTSTGPSTQMALYFLKGLINNPGDDFQSRLSAEIALHTSNGTLDTIGAGLQAMYTAVYTTQIYLQPPLPADPSAKPPKQEATHMDFADLCKEDWYQSSGTDPHDARANAAWAAVGNAMANEGGPLAIFVYNACNFPASVSTYKPPFDTSLMEQVMNALQTDLNRSNFANVASDIEALKGFLGELPSNDPSYLLLHTVLTGEFNWNPIPGTNPPLNFGTIQDFADWLTNNTTNPQYQTVLKYFGQQLNNTSVLSGMDPDGSGGTGSYAQLLQNLLPFLQDQLMNWPKNP